MRRKSSKKIRKLTTFASLLLAHGTLLANPTDPQVVYGDAQFTSIENTLNIMTSDKAVIDWNSFSIGSGEITQFIQPAIDSAVLNRVTGGDLSQIMGTLQANGRVYLVNPNGVVIGKDGFIKAADFVSSTLDMSIEEFINNAMMTFAGSSNGSIINLGKIETLAGTVTLLSETIVNDGDIDAVDVNLLTGHQFYLKPEGTRWITIKPSMVDPEGKISMTGKINLIKDQINEEGSAYSLAIPKSTSDATMCVMRNGKVHLVANQVNLDSDSVIDAGNNGTILLDIGDQLSQLNGSLKASSGHVEIKDQGTLFANGTIDVSGPNGGTVEISSDKGLHGGEILAIGTDGSGGNILINTNKNWIETESSHLVASGIIGGTIKIHNEDGRLFSSGHYESKGINNGGTIAFTSDDIAINAATVDVSGQSGGEISLIANHVQINHATTFKADGSSESHGGKVIVNSEDYTYCAATVTATGRHGGFVEVSGKNKFYYGAQVDVTGLDKSGTLLLDPRNIIIDDTTGTFPHFTLVDPNPSPGFGTIVLPLISGNVVVTKPANAGVVYLYNGMTGALNSTISGAVSTDNVSSGGVIQLTGGDFVISSPNFTVTGVPNAGAVYRGSATSTTNVTLAPNICITGSLNGDLIGNVYALTNGNYVVASPTWDNNKGIVGTRGGVNGNSGTMNSTNSLIGVTGGSPGDRLGQLIVPLENGDYVIGAPNYTINGIAQSGIAFCSTNNGTITPSGGSPSTANCLYGTTANDGVGAVITALDGNAFVVGSPTWHNGATAVGAATRMPLSGPTYVGAVATTNSLYGSTANDAVGTVIVALTNDNYVVGSPTWTNGGAQVGAATWCASTGAVGLVSTTNSTYGSTNLDDVGRIIVPLVNNNYVLVSPLWDNGATANVGAVTLRNGNGSPGAAITTTNSLYGPAANNGTGLNVTALPNITQNFGSFVAAFPSATTTGTPTATAGAVVYSRGTPQDVVTGIVDDSKSLHGTTVGDQVGTSVVALTNGNFLVCSPLWNNTTADVGAITLCPQAAFSNATVTGSNSLHGVTANDGVGLDALAISGGKFVAHFPNFDTSAGTNIGAVVYNDGLNTLTGSVPDIGNSYFGPNASSGLSQNKATNFVEDTVNGITYAVFTSGNGTVNAGLNDPANVDYGQFPSQDLTVSSLAIKNLLNVGTPVIMQANNDITINSPIVANNPSGNGGNLTLSAGRSVTINQNITTDNGNLIITANDTAASGVSNNDRLTGTASFTVANGVIITSGTGSLTLTLNNGAGNTQTTSSDITLGTNSTLTSTTGNITVQAYDHNIVLNSGAAVYASTSGNVLLIAGEDIVATTNADIHSTNGSLTLVVDNLSPTAPTIGTGFFNLANAVTLTAGTTVKLYSALRDLNTVPSTINGTAYVPGEEFANSSQEQWGVYYPGGSGGTPFTIYYKNGGTALSSVSSQTYLDFLTAISEALYKWQFPIYWWGYSDCNNATIPVDCTGSSIKKAVILRAIGDQTVIY
ncbi:MAG: filamentous hemagglutinin N-terminal domain-containing protein [Parachlamydiales bacterium]|nr:filamentous hemagglutinin N-terminal domain-containing protein [Parachlamydiales bacterium]